MTNFDKIKSMSIDELAKLLGDLNDADGNSLNKIGCTNCCYYETHHAPEDCINDRCSFMNVGTDAKKWLEHDVLFDEGVE